MKQQILFILVTMISLLLVGCSTEEAINNEYQQLLSGIPTQVEEDIFLPSGSDAFSVTYLVNNEV